MNTTDVIFNNEKFPKAKDAGQTIAKKRKERRIQRYLKDVITITIGLKTVYLFPKIIARLIGLRNNNTAFTIYMVDF